MKYITIIFILLTIVYFVFPKPREVKGSEKDESITNIQVVRESDEKNKIKDFDSQFKYGDLVRKYSEKYNVSYSLMSAIMEAENPKRNATLQSNIKYNFTISSLGIYNGEREYSFGVVQINLHYNPHITMSQATDPEFSIEFLAKELSLGHHSKWGSYTSGAYLTHIDKYTL